MNREAAFAGSFYPADKKKLTAMLDGFFSGVQKETKREKTGCVVAPHAGYVYSGQTAAFSYSALKKAKTFVILSPNHTGYGRSISIWPDGEWETPLGKAKVNSALSKKIAEALGTETDTEAHLGEHSIEVQLPFLQHSFGNNFDFVAITLGTGNLAGLERLGKAIAEKTNGMAVAVIASSDFTHFETEESAKKKDLAAIKFIEKIDIEGFYSEVGEKQLSICGYAAIIAAMKYCVSAKGFKKGRLLHYDSSATASRDKANVVGYAAIGFY